ncbi:MAG TPA: penicillin acylase family protein [Terriglobales bacterium]|nr:penicillin acylase family protein [Terriglobales bacterium]
MTTPTLSPPASRARSRLGSLLKTLLILFALSGIALCGYFYYAALLALPRLDGPVRVPGLSAPVKVIRDEHGVPTIDAANLEDLFFAQGYVTAQDRLWQMDAMRRFAAGELAEVLGPSQLQHDREQRILGLRDVARRSLQQYSARDRSYVDAYTRGVNAYIQERGDSLPLEFRILRYKPAPWTAEDAVLMGASMVQNLNHGAYLSALEKEKFLARLGPELTGDLFINSSWHDRPPSKAPVRINQPDEDDDSSPGGSDSVTSSRPHPAIANASLGPDLWFPRAGSNNWVVSGAHTVSGKPLLSNDMHLNHQMPNLWYEVHLRSGDFDVVGVSLPGLPFVIVGHNQRIGWGFTNVGPTVEDLFVETLNENGQYQTPQGWRNLDRRREVIHVKGDPDEQLDVLGTRHGPIITDLIPGEKRAVALRWTLYDGLHNPFFDLDSAQNWDQFAKALSQLDSPGQNVVYADVDGHIGYHATGHIPIRAKGDGSLPVNGSDDAHEWTGYVPFEKLPTVIDPSWGILATANGRISPDGYGYSLSTEWDAPWRTERIYRVLESGKKFAPADMLALQTDVYSAFDRFCAERFVYALDHARTVSPRAREALDLMRDWNGIMASDSAAATIEIQARHELARILLEDKFANKNDQSLPNLTAKDYRWALGSVWLENVLLKQPKRWLPGKYADFDAVLVAAVEDAVSPPDAPSKLANWKLGAAYPITIQNPVLGKFPLLSRWTGPGRVPQSGDGFTVKQAAGNLGPSERITVDFSNLDQSTLNTVTGQGGNFLSPYYMDQWKAWYTGFTFTLPYSPGAVDKSKRHVLLLEPVR